MPAVPVAISAETHVTGVPPHLTLQLREALRRVREVFQKWTRTAAGEFIPRKAYRRAPRPRVHTNSRNLLIVSFRRSNCFPYSVYQLARKLTQSVYQKSTSHTLHPGHGDEVPLKPESPLLTFMTCGLLPLRCLFEPFFLLMCSVTSCSPTCDYLITMRSFGSNMPNQSTPYSNAAPTEDSTDPG